MKVHCPLCAERMFFTGDYHPTTEPLRLYACVNKHTKLIRNDPEPDWGDHSANRTWRADLSTPGGIDDYESAD